MTKFVFLGIIVHDEIFGIGEVEFVGSLSFCPLQVVCEIPIEYSLTFIYFILKMKIFIEEFTNTLVSIKLICHL